MAEATPRGPYIQRDRRYVVEWVEREYPGRPVFYNLRLGAAPEEMRAAFPGLNPDRWARVWKKTCDAVVVLPEALVLVEGELRRPSLAIGELIVYRDLIPQTPELRPWFHLPIRTVLISSSPDPSLERTLREAKIELVVFRPPWVEKYLQEVMR